MTSTGYRMDSCTKSWGTSWFAVFVLKFWGNLKSVIIVVNCSVDGASKNGRKIVQCNAQANWESGQAPTFSKNLFISWRWIVAHAPTKFFSLSWVSMRSGVRRTNAPISSARQSWSTSRGRSSRWTVQTRPTKSVTTCATKCLDCRMWCLRKVRTVKLRWINKRHWNLFTNIWMSRKRKKIISQCKIWKLNNKNHRNSNKDKIKNCIRMLSVWSSNNLLGKSLKFSKITQIKVLTVGFQTANPTTSCRYQLTIVNCFYRRMIISSGLSSAQNHSTKASITGRSSLMLGLNTNLRSASVPRKNAVTKRRHSVTTRLGGLTSVSVSWDITPTLQEKTMVKFSKDRGYWEFSWIWTKVLFRFLLMVFILG